MHVDDDTGETIGQYGQTTIQGRKATFHTTCVAQKMQRSRKGEAMRTRIMQNRHLRGHAFNNNNLTSSSFTRRPLLMLFTVRHVYITRK